MYNINSSFRTYYINFSELYFYSLHNYGCSGFITNNHQLEKAETERQQYKGTTKPNLTVVDVTI